MNDVHACNWCLPQPPKSSLPALMERRGPLRAHTLMWGQTSQCLLHITPPPLFFLYPHTQRRYCCCYCSHQVSHLSLFSRLGSSSPSTIRTLRRRSVSSPRCGTPTFMRSNTHTHSPAVCSHARAWGGDSRSKAELFSPEWRRLHLNPAPASRRPTERGASLGEVEPHTERQVLVCTSLLLNAATSPGCR